MITTKQVHLSTARGSLPLAECTVDEILSARSWAWRSYFSNFSNDNGCGQRYRKSFRTSCRDEYDYKERLKTELHIDDIESEIIQRGIDPKTKNFTRVQASVCFVKTYDLK